MQQPESNKQKAIYLIGSLRNPEINRVANELRKLGFEVFDDWTAAGPNADDCWRDYEKQRGHDYAEALQGYAAKHVFALDVFHINRCDIVVLVMPAGKSGHMELGYALGKGKPGFVLFDQEPERFDVMYQFATGVFLSEETLFDALKSYLT
jgi:nucleoside 2-deoxyribosyltransferase